MSYVERAIQDRLIEIKGEGKTERIHYKAANHTERWSDPEEKVRAEFWAELIYKYEYRPNVSVLRSKSLAVPQTISPISSFTKIKMTTLPQQSPCGGKRAEAEWQAAKQWFEKQLLG